MQEGMPVATVEELEQQVIGLRREIEEMRQKFSFHLGYDESQATIHNPHPNMSTSERAGVINQLQIAEGGSIVDANGSRWDTNGITLADPSTIAYGVKQIEIVRAAVPTTSLLWDGWIQSGSAHARIGPNWTDGTDRWMGFAGGLMDIPGVAADTWGMAGVFYDGVGPMLRAIAINGSGNWYIGFGPANFGGGAGVGFIENRGAAPSSNPSGGGFLYAEAGSLRWRGSSGTVTTIATA